MSVQQGAHASEALQTQLSSVHCYIPTRMFELMYVEHTCASYMSKCADGVHPTTERFLEGQQAGVKCGGPAVWFGRRVFSPAT